MTSPLGPSWPAAAVPIAPKMPAPITAPMASMIRSPAPSSRFSAFGWFPSINSSDIGFRARSDFIRGSRGIALDEQRREHERDRAQELDEDVQRRTRRVLERIAHGVTH